MRRAALAFSFAALAFSLGGCAGGQRPASPRLPAARPEAVEALKDAARLVRLGAAQYERAVERLKEATAIDDTLWEAWYDQGWLALKLRHFAAAAAALEKARSLAPQHQPTVEGLAQAQLALGHPEEAVRVYRAAVERFPDSIELRVALGAALRRSGKLDDAVEALRQALRRAPRAATALAGLGLVYQAKGQLELAELVLRRALEIDEKSAPTWNNLGLVALARRRDQEAFAHFDHAARLDPQLAVARRNQALVHLDCGDYARAAEELAQATKADPDDVDAWVALGVAERGRGQPQAAVRAYEQALAVAPGAPDALFDLGVLYMDFQKEPARARERLRQFLAAAPEAHPRRAAAATRLKDLAKTLDPAPSPAARSPGGGGS
jgi:tetratricopeptide (TPR) repeat protein